MNPDPPGRHPSRWIDLVAALFAATVACAVFWPALSAGFVDLDDQDLFVQNASFRGLDLPHLRWMFATTRMGHYAPLFWLSAAVDHALFGLDPRAFHRTNLLLHALNAALFYLVAARLLAGVRFGRSGWARERPVALRLGALFASLVFAIHPLRVESVAWATERRGLLAASFLLVALLAWLRAFEPASPRLVSGRWYAVSLAALVLSLLAKGLGMTFAAIVVLLDVYPLRRLPADIRGWWARDRGPVWIQKLPVLALGGASAALSSWAARSVPDTVKSLEEWGLLARIAQAGYGLLFYVRKTLWPADLSPIYELPARFDALEPRFVLGMLVAAALVPILVVLRRRALGLATAAAAYAVAIAPVLGLAQAGPQLVADRYSYVACMPWALVAGAGLLWILVRSPAVLVRVSVVALAAGALVGLGLAARHQTHAWHDSLSLWNRALESGQRSSIVYNNLGTLLGRAGRLEEAAGYFRASLAIRPDQGRAWFNLGAIHELEGRVPEAEDAFKKAAAGMKPAWDPLCRLGGLYLDRLHRVDEAVKTYARAVADVESSGPELFSPLPYLGLGLALSRKGEREKARAVLEYAARFPETREPALKGLGRL